MHNVPHANPRVQHESGLLQVGGAMVNSPIRFRTRVAGVAFVCVLFASPVISAQDSGKASDTKLEDAEAPPVMWGEYEAHSSTDLGWVSTDFSGSPLTQQTFVN